jgi:UDP-glucuronate 4-epimerase
LSTILVTGAAGFIGSHLAERLLARGERVVGLDNFDPFYSRDVKERNLAALLEHPGFQFVEADLCDAARLRDLFVAERTDRIAHLAAKAGVRPSLRDPAGYVEANVRGTANLLQLCSERPPEHFVFASSSSVYGDTTEVPFSEEQRTDTPASPYAATKKAGEVLCFTYHQLVGMPVTCLRFFTVFGPRQRPDLAIHKFTRLIDRGEPVPFFGDGSASRDYTFVADTVDGVVAALDRPAGYEIYNLGHSSPVTLAEMVATIEGCLGKPANLQRLPDQPGDVRTTFADISKAKARLGYEPKVVFAEGVERFVRWYREQP